MPTTKDWNRVPYARVAPREKSPPILANNARLSGADRQIAKDAELVEWLTKCLGEIEVEGSQAWPVFSEAGLRGFLAASGSPVPPRQEKSDELHATVRETAAHLPAALSQPEGCVKNLTGASFLTQTAGQVCAHLNRRRQMARR